MSAYDFLYKLATHYYLYNNSFALLNRDDRGNLTGVYPITANHVDVLSDPQGLLYCRFYFKGGKQAILPYSDLIHLRRNFNSDDLLGDDNSALIPALELAHTQNEGIISGIKAGANIRGILKYTQIMGYSQQQSEPLVDTVSGFLLTLWYYGDHSDTDKLQRVIDSLLKAITLKVDRSV